jgi:hypothetical protein
MVTTLTCWFAHASSRKAMSWFDIPMDHLLPVHRSQTGGNLRYDFERRLCL